MGADVHAKDDYALRLAAFYGHYDVVKLLLNHGADVYKLNIQAVRWAKEKGYIDLANLLLDNGAIFN